MEEYELVNIRGGAVKWVVIGGIVTAVTFIIGIIDGYLRPLKCRN